MSGRTTLEAAVAISGHKASNISIRLQPTSYQTNNAMIQIQKNKKIKKVTHQLKTSAKHNGCGCGCAFCRYAAAATTSTTTARARVLQEYSLTSPPGQSRIFSLPNALILGVL